MNIDAIKEAVRNSFSFTESLRTLGVKDCISTYHALKQFCRVHDINTNHFYEGSLLRRPWKSKHK